MTPPKIESCLFCRIAAGEVAVYKVYEDEFTQAFLDHRPIFPGHLLVIPREHYETLAGLPQKWIEPFFAQVQKLAIIVQAAMGADGSFVAMNNIVSQSVPHLHAHIVPRKRKDGLKGFFWPRTKYKSEEEMQEIANLIRKEVNK